MPGDVAEFQFRASSSVWLQALQLYWIEQRLQNKNFEILSTAARPDEKLLIIKIQVLSEPQDIVYKAGISAGAIVALIAAAAAGLWIWLSLVKVSKLMESPAGAITVASWSIAAVLFVVWLLLRKK